jgi:hypothetical protein
MAMEKVVQSAANWLPAANAQEEKRERLCQALQESLAFLTAALI